MKLRGIVIARFCVAESWRALRSNSPILANPKKSLESVRLLESFMDSAEVSLSVIARKSARIFVAIYFFARFYGIAGIFLRILYFLYGFC